MAILNWDVEGKIPKINVVEPPPSVRCEKCGTSSGTKVRKVIVKKRQGKGADKYKVIEQSLCDRCYSGGATCSCCGVVSPAGDSVYRVISALGARGGDDQAKTMCGICINAPNKRAKSGSVAMMCPCCGTVYTADLMTRFEGKRLAKDTCVDDGQGGLPSGINDDGFFACRRCGQRLRECAACNGHTMHIHRLNCRANSEQKQPSVVELCQTCMQNTTPTTQEYNYVPEMVFFSHKEENPMTAIHASKIVADPYFGVELEMDCGGKGKEFTKWANRGLPGFYVKRDGSLSPLGVEMVSYPATLEFHMNKIGWETLLQKAREAGYVSWNAEKNCGLHVHIGRWAFDPNQKLSSKPGNNGAPALRALSRFYGNNFRQIAALSGRENEQYSALRQFEQFVEPEDIDIHSGSGHGATRYWAVNMTNKHTIELRHFRGSMRHDTIMMAITYAHALAAFCMQYYKTDYEDNPSLLYWNKFCRFVSDVSIRYNPYLLLTKELDRRGLFYIDESSNTRWLAKHGRRSLADIVYEESLEHREVTIEEINSNVTP